MKKGQSALEFLMTYGWAILIIVIVVGVAYAMGLTQPCKWVGTQISQFSEFKVENPKFTVSPSTLAFDMSSPKQTVTVTAISVSGDGTGNVVPSPALPNNQGTTAARYTVTLSSVKPAANSCYSADVTISYSVSVAGGNETYTSTGKLSGVAS